MRTGGSFHFPPKSPFTTRTSTAAGGDYAIVTGSAGPWLLVDNIIRNRQGYDGPAVRLTAQDQTLVGNTFTAPNPIEMGSATLRIREIDSQTVARDTVPEPDLELPPVPPNLGRKVFEVPKGTGNDASAIQAQIDAAAQEAPGSRPVVHIPKGQWSLGSTVTIPAGKDVQLVGDGTENGTRLDGSGAGGPAIVVEGPSRAVLRDLWVQGNSAIVVANADQPGGRVYANQLQADSSGNAAVALLVDGVETADVTLVATGFEFCKRGVVVRGGPVRAAGGDAPGQVSVLMAGLSNNGPLFDVENGGELLAEAVWYEGESPPSGLSLIDLTSSGKFTLTGLHGAHAAGAAAPLFRVDGFQGTFALLVNALTTAGLGGDDVHRIELTGDGSGARVLALGNNFIVAGLAPGGGYVDSGDVWKDTSSPAADAAMSQCILNGDGQFVPGGFADLPNIYKNAMSTEPDDAFVRDALAQLRAARIEPPNKRPDGATDLKLFRVAAWNTSTGNVVEIRR